MNVCFMRCILTQQLYYHHRVDGPATTHHPNYCEQKTQLDVDLQRTFSPGKK